MDDLVRLATWQLLTRLIIVACPLIVVAASVAASDDRLAPIVLVLVVVLGVLTALAPDSHAGGCTLAVLALVWLARVDDATSRWVLVAAGAVTVFHALTALTAGAPPGAVLGHVLLRRWAGRTAVVLVATIAVWGLVAALDHREDKANAVLLAVALGVIATGAGLIHRSSRAE